MTVRVRHVHAFTSRPFEGNPAGVVPEASGLPVRTMQAIARELRLSETAFVLPASSRRADLRIRWFTPTCEVSLCGHATIAAFHVLAEEGMKGMKQQGRYVFRLETRSGILRVVVEKRYSGTVIEFQLPIPAFRRVKVLPPGLLAALGCAAADVHDTLPTVRGRDLYLPLRSRRKLWTLKPEMKRLHGVCEDARLLGVCAFTLRTVEEGSAVHSRFFAPVVGVDEDPVTGSGNGPLGAYLYTYAEPAGFIVPSLWLPDGRLEYIGEQGDVLGRRGRVKIRLSVGRTGLRTLSVAGEAVTLMRSELILS